MKNKIQPSFFDYLKQTSSKADRPLKLSHGGELNKGKRKEKRTIHTNKWIHLVLKSKSAKGHLSLLNIKHRLKIDRIIRQEAQKNFVIIGEGVNMGNHFHLKVKCKEADYFKRFLRVVTGKIAMLVTGAKKGKSFGKRFWDDLAFTRILRTSKEELGLKGYFKANRIERAKGYQARENFLKSFNNWVLSLNTA